MNQVVHTCPYCKEEFDLKALIHDPSVDLIGMSFVEDDPEWVYYFFQHEKPNCGSSFVVKVDEFHSEINEPIPTEKLTGRDCCEQHCVSIEDLNACQQECHFAPYRRFLQKMLEWKTLIRESSL